MVEASSISPNYTQGSRGWGHLAKVAGKGWHRQALNWHPHLLTSSRGRFFHLMLHIPAPSLSGPVFRGGAVRAVGRGCHWEFAR